jgi:hypothetical protein
MISRLSKKGRSVTLKICNELHEIDKEKAN